MKKACLLLLGVPLLVLAACGDDTVTSTTSSSESGGESSSSSGPIAQNPVNDKIAALRTGFRVEGDLVVEESYFADSSFQVPDEALETKEEHYRVVFLFQDHSDYVGIDRRAYEVLEDGSLVYSGGENAYDEGGYAALVYLDYGNQVVRGLAADADGELIPYGANGLINPFKMIQREDLSPVEGWTYSLSPSKASIFFSTLFSQTEGYRQNVAFSTREVTFGEGFASAHFVSEAMDGTSASTVGTEEDPYHQTWVRRNYEVSLAIDQIGTANAKDVIQAQPMKAENEPLRNALQNMEGKEVTLSRRISPYMDGVYVGEDSCLTVYNMGEDEGIYSQSYSLEEGEEAPTAPSASDFLLKSVLPGGKLRVHQWNASQNAFQMNSSNFTGIDNVFTYAQVAYSLSGLSANIFDRNEDGSYTPNLDNIPFIVRDVFMSTFDTFTPVDNGYVTDVKVYVDEAENCISHVESTYSDFLGNSGTMNISFSGLGDSKPPFPVEII